MSREVGHAVAEQVLEELRGKSYDDCRRLIDHVAVRIVRGPDGRDYQVEIEAFWDSQSGRDIRVLVSASGGGLDNFVPSTADFIISPGAKSG